MNKPTPTFSMDDLLAQLQEMAPQFAEGECLTTVELADAARVSENTMRRWLKPLKDNGTIQVTRKQVEALNGRLMTVTAWAVPQPTS